MKNAIIYTRTANGTNENLQAQKIVCQDFAKQKGYVIVGECADIGKADFDKIINYAKQGQLQYVIVSSLDRISRNRLDYINLCFDLAKYNVEIVSTTETPNTIVYERFGNKARFYKVVF